MPAMSLRTGDFNGTCREALMALHLSRRFRYSRLRSVDEERLVAFQQERFLRLLALAEARDDIHALIAESDGTARGYVILHTGSINEIAGTGQAHIAACNLEALSDDSVISSLLSEAEKRAKSSDCHHIDISVPADDTMLRHRLEVRGYSEECYDFIIKSREITCRPDGRFSVRPALEEDLDGILRLACHNADSLISPYRSVTIDDAGRSISRLMSALPEWLRGGGDFAVLTARERLSSDVLGFSLLHVKHHNRGIEHRGSQGDRRAAELSLDQVPDSELFERTTVDEITGTEQGCFLFISVARQEWGKSVARHLTAASASLFGRSGFEYFSGEMLCRNHNPRARLQRMYGPLFDIEKVQMVKRLI